MPNLGSMNKRELIEARYRLESFVDPLLATLGRTERRRWGALYLQGLLLEGGRKTAAGIARSLQGDEQALQQLLSQSPWESEPLRGELARKMMGFVSPKCGWIIGDTGFPKKGQHSVGVARQYSGTLGKVGNCQIAVSLNYATEDACFPLDFSLYLPTEWLEDGERRKRAGVPGDAVFRRKWELALDMIDRAVAWGVSGGVVVADAGYGVATGFRCQLRQRCLSYVVGIQPETGFWLEEVQHSKPSYQGRGRPRTRPRELPEPESAQSIAGRLEASNWCEVIWRQGSKGPLSSRFMAIKAQPSHGHPHGKIVEPLGWLLAEWPYDEDVPKKFWVSNLAEDVSLRDLVYWAKLRWWVEQNYQQLKDQLGLDHFEGRTWSGWHHHVTLTMMAFDFLVLETLRAKNNYWVDPAQSAPRDCQASGDSVFELLPDVLASIPAK
ncbi:MAG: IS701 family transposase [Bacillota bacterium]|nr:IS701 family transposase [Bacillota bacterium]